MEFLWKIFCKRSYILAKKEIGKKKIKKNNWIQILYFNQSKCKIKKSEILKLILEIAKEYHMDNVI